LPVVIVIPVTVTTVTVTGITIKHCPGNRKKINGKVAEVARDQNFMQ
jgi:hypothetical protein